ncbi:unnamed protein product [Phaeothamnion confervicola]
MDLLMSCSCCSFPFPFFLRCGHAAAAVLRYWSSERGAAPKYKPTASEDLSVSLNLLLVGPAKTGKSCLRNRWCEGRYTPDVAATLSVDFNLKLLEMVGGERPVAARCHVYDSSGEGAFTRMGGAYLQAFDSVVFVYDVTDKTTLERIESFVLDFATQACIGGRRGRGTLILVGNKSDCPPEDREVDGEIGRSAAARMNMQFFEASAKTGAGVSAALLASANAALAALPREQAGATAREGLPCVMPRLGRLRSRGNVRDLLSRLDDGSEAGVAEAPDDSNVDHDGGNGGGDKGGGGGGCSGGNSSDRSLAGGDRAVAALISPSAAAICIRAPRTRRRSATSLQRGIAGFSPPPSDLSPATVCLSPPARASPSPMPASLSPPCDRRRRPSERHGNRFGNSGSFCGACSAISGDVNCIDCGGGSAGGAGLCEGGGSGGNDGGSRFAKGGGGGLVFEHRRGSESSAWSPGRSLPGAMDLATRSESFGSCSGGLHGGGAAGANGGDHDGRYGDDGGGGGRYGGGGNDGGGNDDGEGGYGGRYGGGGGGGGCCSRYSDDGSGGGPDTDSRHGEALSPLMTLKPRLLAGQRSPTHGSSQDLNQASSFLLDAWGVAADRSHAQSLPARSPSSPKLPLSSLAPPLSLALQALSSPPPPAVLSPPVLALRSLSYSRTSARDDSPPAEQRRGKRAASAM